MKNRESKGSLQQQTKPQSGGHAHTSGITPRQSARGVRAPLPHEQVRPLSSPASTPRPLTRNTSAAQQKPSHGTPAAPPVYRPQPVPVVLQRKEPIGRPPSPGAGSKVSTRPAAPPVYRPQPTPKVLQAKSALPQAATPRPPQHPAARARLRPSPLARPSVVQLMETNTGSSGEDDDWQKDAQDWEAQQQRYRQLSQQKKAQQKEEKETKKTTKPSTPSNVRQSNLRETHNHLETFSVSKEMFGKAVKQGNRLKANQVSLLAKVNGSPVPDDKNNSNEHDEEIRSPSSALCVVNSTTDGEVKPLIEAMQNFIGHLKRAKTQRSEQSFTVALFGAWGACDGCKQRLIKFAQVWEDEAARYMKEGVTATLRITYKYQNPAEDFEMEWGITTYGWRDDGQQGPCFHTIETSIVGTNKNA